jgi:hypothetical protein
MPQAWAADGGSAIPVVEAVSGRTTGLGLRHRSCE